LPSADKGLYVAYAPGADFVKFQLVYARELASPVYQYFSLFQGLEMTDADWQTVADEARAGGIGLVVDVFGHESLALAGRLGAAAVKIHVTDFFNDPLIDRALQTVPEVFFSAGGMTPDDIAAFLSRRPAGAVDRMTLLYGFQAEPTATADNRLGRLTSIRARFPGLKVGFLDHADGASDEGGWLGAVAVGLGASMIEKHITLDRRLQMEDYVSALAPEPFAAYVARIRAAEVAVGTADLSLSEAEQAYRRRAVKIVVATRAMARGHRVGEGDVALLRTAVVPGQPTLERFGDAHGRSVARDIAAWAAVSPEDLS